MDNKAGAVVWELDLDGKKFKAQLSSSKRDMVDFGKHANKQSSFVGRGFAAAASKFVTATKIMAVAATAAFGKFVIAGGISRALNIEDAQAKLKGLGHDTKAIDKIMSSALKSVQGTAFGLGDAATAAASAVAAGVQPGKDLTKYLTTVGDAATIAGVSFTEMGSIFGKVQTQQRAYTQELNMLADRGIPIYQWLQKELGVTQEELREMVAAGKVDSATYFKAIQKNIGGAALESGKTTRGAWANLKAAMARLGEAITKDIIPKVRQAFNDMTKWIDKNKDQIVKTISGAVDKFKEFSKAAINLGKQVGSYLAPKFQQLLAAVKNILPTFITFLKTYVVPLAQGLGTLLVGAIGAVITVMAGLINAIRPLMDFLNRNSVAVYAFVGALVALKIGLMLQSAFMALQTGLAALGSTFVVQTLMTAGLTKGVGLLALAFKGFLISIGPVGWALAGLATVGAILAGQFAANRQKTDELTGANERLMILTDRLKESQDRLKGAELGVEGASLRLERAQINAKQAVEEYGKGSLEAREANLQLKQAQADLKKAHEEAGLATLDHLLREQQYAQNGELIAAADAKASAIDRLRAQLQMESDRAIFTNYGQGVVRPASGGQKVPGFATGTDFAPGGVALVGEKGPELVNLPRGAQVIPNHKLVGGESNISQVTYNISSINIAKEVDADRFLARLTKDQELASKGLSV